ncbi:hypothetical protein VNO77_41572 [Canavalia gladiata]|uniref:Uncharacterized protein n=1 Tax=Canavalia gladiata TaxID=3824 RepID=A0AAN9PQB8_CANGL
MKGATGRVFSFNVSKHKTLRSDEQRLPLVSKFGDDVVHVMYCGVVLPINFRAFLALNLFTYSHCLRKQGQLT